MGRDQTVIAIGVGCRKGCPAEEIVALIREALPALPAGSSPNGLFSIEEKRGEAGLAQAAALLGLPLVFFDKGVLRTFSGQARTVSPRVDRMHGLPSVAETAALAGAGRGAILLAARRASARATCAIAAQPLRRSEP